MKYDVTFSCGHEGTVTLFGKGSERERKLEWYKNYGMCPTCRKKQFNAKREAEEAASKREARNHNLPELTGSPKQIKWALTLRSEMLRSLRRSSRGMYTEMRKECHEYYYAIDSAKWWIDNRGDAYGNRAVENDVGPLLIDRWLKNVYYPAHPGLKERTEKAQRIGKNIIKNLIRIIETGKVNSTYTDKDKKACLSYINDHSTVEWWLSQENRRAEDLLNEWKESYKKEN